MIWILPCSSVVASLRVFWLEEHRYGCITNTWPPTRLTGIIIITTIIIINTEREMFYLTTHSTHFMNGYMVSDIWLRTILIVRKETLCRYIGYFFRLAARVLLYAPSHRQDNTYHSLCYASVLLITTLSIN